MNSWGELCCQFLALWGLRKYRISPPDALTRPDGSVGPGGPPAPRRQGRVVQLSDYLHVMLFLTKDAAAIVLDQHPEPERVSGKSNRQRYHV